MIERTGREALAGRLLDLARAGLEGRGAALVVLSGPRGVGRSTVLADLATAVADGSDGVGGDADDEVTVVAVRGVAWETAASGALLRQVVPEVRVEQGDDPVGLAGEVVAALLAHARAALVLVDDVDDADPLSLQALATAVRHHRDRRLVVVAMRDRGRTGPGAAVLTRAADAEVEVPPLTADEVGALAARGGITLHASLAEHLVRHTGGRPAHVADLLDSLPRDTWRGAAPPLPAPTVVVEQVTTLLATTGGAARGLVHAVAVLGPETPVPLAARVAGTDVSLEHVDAAVRTGLLELRGRSAEAVLSVRDDMTAAAVRTAMGAVEEARLHREAARHVEDEAQRLAHLAAASVVPDAGLAARAHDLARLRAGSGAWGAAAALYLLASRTSAGPAARDERLLLAVDALVGAGDLPAAASYLAEIESLPETAMRNAVLGYLAILRGRASEAGSRLTRAWRLEHGDRHPAIAATIAQRHVLHHLARCDGASLVTWADRAVDLVGHDDPTAVEAQAIRGLGLGSTGRLDEAIDSYRTLWTQAGRGAVGQRVQMGSGWLNLVADQVETARAELTSAVPTDYLGGSVRISLWAQAWLARTHLATGEWDQAVHVAASGLDVARRAGLLLLEPLLRWTTTQVHALRGDWDAAVEGARAGGAPSGYEVMWVPTCLARAAVAEARADYAGVLAALAPLVRPGVSEDLVEPGFWPWPDVYANALVLEGDLAGADAFLARHERLALDREHRSARARLGYARGRLLGARGDIDGARRSFETSLELLEGLPLVVDRARVNFAYGQTLRRAGKRRDADVVISEAREAYAALGATTYVRRCERELKAGGVRADLRHRPAEALTPQEQAVAGLVARGLRNREVAAELFLSVKTVQFHLTRVYAKLGVRSRVELAALGVDVPGRHGGAPSAGEVAP